MERHQFIPARDRGGAGHWANGVLGYDAGVRHGRARGLSNPGGVVAEGGAPEAPVTEGGLQCARCAGTICPCQRQIARPVRDVAKGR